jgi:hypothetical protein
MDIDKPKSVKEFQVTEVPGRIRLSVNDLIIWSGLASGTFGNQKRTLKAGVQVLRLLTAKRSKTADEEAVRRRFESFYDESRLERVFASGEEPEDEEEDLGELGMVYKAKIADLERDVYSIMGSMMWS